MALGTAHFIYAQLKPIARTLKENMLRRSQIVSFSCFPNQSWQYLNKVRQLLSCNTTLTRLGFITITSHVSILLFLFGTATLVTAFETAAVTSPYQS